ncbi:C40 family peptidase [Arcticibacter tournemirensis]
MKRVYLLLVFFIAAQHSLPAYADNDSVQVKRAEELLHRVQRQFAPDKRTSVFNAVIESATPLSIRVETTSKEALLHLRKILAQSNIESAINEHLLPSADLGNRIYGIASLSVCNNRSRPTHTAELVSQTLLGTPVEILKKESGYYLVRTPEGYISWTEEAGISVVDETVFTKWKYAERIVFTSEYGHAYSEADPESLPVSDLVAGNILELKGKKKKFYKVAYPDGRTGYIPVKQSELYRKWVSRPDPDASGIIRTAKSLTGVPYLWGGTSVKGVDCSGFTKMSYYLNGIILARDASQQALTGEPVDILENDTVSIEKCLQNLLPGDLLFFGRKKADGGASRVIHTAIYIGKGEFIQSAGMVRINSLLKEATNYDTYQTRTLLSARRILTAVGTEGISRIDKHSLYQTVSK